MTDRSPKHRKRILVEAYECSPVRAHAPGSAWQILSRLANIYDIWIITEETVFKDEVEEHFRQNPFLSEHMTFHFLPRRRPEGFDRTRPAIPIREILEYKEWGKRSYLFAKTLHRKIGFDLAHHLRSDSFRVPGFLWQLPIPFVWGPTGGTDNIPWEMLDILGPKGKIRYAIRNIINTMQLKYSPVVRRAVKRTDCLISQTSKDKENIFKVHGILSILVHEQACNSVSGTCHHYDPGRNLNIAWIGRCVTSKALPFLLKVISRPGIRDKVTLHIAGNGPKWESWKRMANDLNVDSQCIWYGWLAQKTTSDLLNSCDILAFTSVLEATSATVMESLSLGVPVICFNRCGFGDVINNQNGISIRYHNKSQAMDHFSRAIESLILRPEKLAHLSQGALKAASRYSWDNLVAKIRDCYESVIVT